MKKIFKMIGISIVAIIALLLIAVTLFLNLSPQFGKGASREQKIEYAKSGHYENGIFVNQSTSIMNIHYWDRLKEMLEGSPNRRPNKEILVEKIDSTAIENNSPEITRLTWFGHSTFLLEID